MDFVGMALSESGRSILLHVQPLEGRGDIDAGALRDWLVREGYGDCLLHHEALERAAKDAIAAPAPFSLAVAERCDATVVVHIATDAMSASLDIKPARGGAPARLRTCAMALSLRAWWPESMRWQSPRRLQR